MKSYNILKSFSFLIVLLGISTFTYALFPENVPSLGQIATHLTFGTHLITNLMHLVSFVVGTSLLVMGVLFFKANRENPKYMPLDKVVLYVICGIILMALPFFNRIFGETGSTVDMQRHENSKVMQTGIDAPLEWGNDYEH